MTVGERIKAQREKLGLSQGDLASIMGVSRQAISKAELHDSNITTEKVSKFAKALGCTEGFLMGWEKSPEELLKEAYERKHEQELLLTYFAQLTPEKQDSVLNLIKTMI